MTAFLADLAHRPNLTKDEVLLLGFQVFVLHELCDEVRVRLKALDKNCVAERPLS